MNILRNIICLSFCIFFTIPFLIGQDKSEKESFYLDKVSMNGLKFRALGPALTSGRISDFAVDQKNPYIYYVATSSGGVWKTMNAGTTFKPIFDSQGSYSIGCVTIDPNNPNVIWIGSGENNNQRSVAYGDGIYKSMDGGRSWKNMGLKSSEHIGKIIVHPDNSNVVYVAAIGPLWKEGGERGVYKTSDGGATWELILEISEHTGVNDIVMDPRNPDVLYASAYQRRRHVFTYLGGGPESTIYKTTDGGQSWQKANKGLPGVDLGRIAFAISPADPEIIYAIVEASQGKSGFFRSTNRGASWEKRSSHATSGNYYQEIIADPKNPDVVYSMDTWFHVTKDGGKSFKRVGEDTKHVDNHCMWIDPNNTNHWLVGCDGGIYETWDAASTWDFKANLPITQFYKVTVDNDEPFYNIYGGTQDNFSLGGPSRSIKQHGISNEDWIITRGGDGFESQVDPENPNIIYAQSQYGGLFRYDKLSGEEVGIQPKPGKDEPAYRWNWDAPLAVSHHQSGRLFFAANKLFVSDDYGNSWQTISPDLSRQINRNELEVMGKIWGIDALAKNRSTSPYGAIVAFSESPVNKELLVVGTDDGLIQISQNSGQDWNKVDGIKGIPERSYVNAVYTSNHDANVIYAAFNHHKYGDFKPYIVKSTDGGTTWKLISNNLPERGSIYSIEEDHVDPNLLFVGTEFGVFFSNNGGNNWKQLKAGLPTIAVRDMAIQRRENDLVLATFGRGFYVLDDYAALRSINEQTMEKEGSLFAVRDALMFIESQPLGLPGKAFQGDSYYLAENLGPEALIRYYMKESLTSLKEQRRKAEKEALKKEEAISYPGYEDYKAELETPAPQLLVTIKDGNGQLIREWTVKPRKGINTIKWDLRYPSKRPVRLTPPSFYNAFAGKDQGNLVAPGTYEVSLSKIVNGGITLIDGPQSFEVKPLNNTTFKAENRAEKVAFQQQVTELGRRFSTAQNTMRSFSTQMSHIRVALKKMDKEIGPLLKQFNQLEGKIRVLQLAIGGDRVARALDMDTPPSIGQRIGSLNYEQVNSTAPPTETHKQQYAIVKELLAPVLEEIQSIQEKELPALQKALEEAGAPYTPGRLVESKN